MPAFVWFERSSYGIGSELGAENYKCVIEKGILQWVLTVAHFGSIRAAQFNCECDVNLVQLSTYPAGELNCSS